MSHEIHHIGDRYMYVYAELSICEYTLIKGVQTLINRVYGEKIGKIAVKSEL